MRIAGIGCPFKTSYGEYFQCLRESMEQLTGDEVRWVASNCGCGDDAEIARDFQMPGRCEYFEMQHVRDYASNTPWKRHLRQTARSLFFYPRAWRYTRMTSTSEVAHFQQTLHAYGSTALFHWLNTSSPAARVVTVHELDAQQLATPRLNRTYNRADAVIVHCKAVKRQLIDLGVDEDRIHVVLHGTHYPDLSYHAERKGIVFYGGHKLMKNKGLQSLLGAMAMLRQRLGERLPTLTVHGHYAVEAPDEAKQLAATLGISDKVRWLDHLTPAAMLQEYATSMMCVLPFAGSFAGLPAAAAAATGLPVIGTETAGLPDHLDNLGLWVEAGNTAQLADRIAALLDNAPQREELFSKLRERARQHLRWEIIAQQTLDVYGQARLRHGLRSSAA